MDSKRGLNTIFCDFFQFFEAPDPPQIEQNLQKSEKKCWKFDVEKNNVFAYHFHQIFVVLASENEANIQYFSLFFRKRRFNEN